MNGGNLMKMETVYSLFTIFDFKSAKSVLKGFNILILRL